MQEVIWQPALPKRKGIQDPTGSTGSHKDSQIPSILQSDWQQLAALEDKDRQGALKKEFWRR